MRTEDELKAKMEEIIKTIAELDGDSILVDNEALFRAISFLQTLRWILEPEKSKGGK